MIEAIAMDEKRTGLGWNFHSNPGPCASSWRCSLQVSFPRPTNLLDSVRNLRALDSPAIFRQKKSDVPTSAWAAPHLHVTSGLAKDPRTISSGIRLAVDVSGSARRGPVCENTSGVCLAGGCVAGKSGECAACVCRRCHDRGRRAFGITLPGVLSPIESWSAATWE